MPMTIQQMREKLDRLANQIGEDSPVVGYAAKDGEWFVVDSIGVQAGDATPAILHLKAE